MFDLYTQLDRLNLEQQIVYPKSPIICYESSSRCYVNNPYLGEVKEYPNSLCFQDEVRYEGWADWSERVIVKDDKKAWEIINSSREFINNNIKHAKELQQLDYENISNQEFVEALLKIDQILEAEYHLYIFFIDECFEVSDPELLKILPEVRIELSEFVDELHASCDKVIAALAERYDMDWEISTYATFQEIIDLLKERISLEDFKKIKGREIAFLSLDNEFVILKGEEAVKFKKYLHQRQGEGANAHSRLQKEIKGMTVFKGRAQGEVVILTEDQYYSHPEKVFSGKQDFVLVTPMTRPEIVSYLKKAVAIVTDEGGITCHAAIVARELKIPTIVGTKIASKILKPGDRVRVDSEKGTITKI